MTGMKILILSCGTRCKLVEYFKDRKNGFDKVVVTDCNEYAPALYVSDCFYIVSRMNAPTYLDEIYDICIKEQINVILPLQEEELLLMAKNRYRFERKNILVAISDYEKIKLCKDKYELYQYLNKQNIPTIETFLAEDILKERKEKVELFVKPRCGAGSVGAMKVKTRTLLEALVKESKDELVAQPYIEGKEYGVDVYVDFQSGDIIAMFCKEKLRMRAGETEKSISVNVPQIFEIVGETIAKMKLKGALDMDILENNGKFYILEINPRFGGGYPHAYACGINFPKMLAINAQGEINHKVDEEYPENLVALKFSDIITVTPN